MDDHELRELQDPDTWEEMEDGIVYPSKTPRADVSVWFSVEEVAQIERQCRPRGLTIIQFVRQAALDRAAEDGELATAASRGAAHPNMRGHE